MNTANPSVAADLRVGPLARTVLKHLKRYGTISPMEADAAYGITTLAGRIHELRHKAGYPIKSELRTDGAGHRYARYYLVTVQ